MILLNRFRALHAIRASEVYVPTFPHVNVPKACQLLIFMCQNANVAISVPKGLPFFQVRLPKVVAIFQLFFKRIIFFYIRNKFISKIFYIFGIFQTYTNLIYIFYMSIYLRLYVVCKKSFKNNIHPGHHKSFWKSIYHVIWVQNNLQKQPFVFQNRCSYEFCNSHTKTAVLESFFNKVADCTDWNFKKKTPTQVFSYEYCEISKNSFFYKTPQVADSVLKALQLLETLS